MHLLSQLLLILLYNIWCYQILLAVWVLKEFYVDFAPSFSKEAPIQCISRNWHLPSQVGEMHRCSFFMQHKITIRSTIYSRNLMIVLLGQLPAECLILCWVWFLVVIWYLNFATAAVTFPSFWLLSKGSHYWERHLTFWGPTVLQLSHSVFYFWFLLQDFLILLKRATWNSSIIQFRTFLFFVKIF